MQLTLNRSSVADVLEDLQSAIDKRLNSRRVRMQTYGLKYKVYKENMLIKFKILHFANSCYYIVGEISKNSDNTYNISVSLKSQELIIWLASSIILSLFLVDTIISDDYFGAVAMSVFFILTALWDYKRTERILKKICSELKTDRSDQSIVETKSCNFESFLNAGQDCWTYFRTPSPFIRKQKMTVIDHAAGVCVEATAYAVLVELVTWYSHRYRVHRDRAVLRPCFF